MNLCFSSINEAHHETVINQCYWPILDLIKQGLPAGLEMSGYTLERILQLSPDWVSTLQQFLKKSACELIAAGDSQLIGPLVPARLTQENIRLGMNTYQRILGTAPKLAYINEQAASAGLMDIYIDSGFEGVIVEWDNPFSHCHWPPESASTPCAIFSAQGRTIPAIWNHAIAFQKFQRYAHGQLTQDDYLDFLKQRIDFLQTLSPDSALPVYGNDAEIFDFRPGRYRTEAQHQHGEWHKIKQIINITAQWENAAWSLPSALLDITSNQQRLSLACAAHPVSVKKQAKYNITRWGVSGRNDLLLNTLCYRQFQALNTSMTASDEDWRTLCRNWASDYRTHLTEERYDRLQSTLDELSSLGKSTKQDEPIKWMTLEDASTLTNKDFTLSVDHDRRLLTLKNNALSLTLNMQRGLAIERLSFATHDFVPIIGTHPHGHFDHIMLGADFYSNHLVMERYKARDRVTDLDPGIPKFSLCEQSISLCIDLSLPSGDISKWYRVHPDHLECGFRFHHNERPEGSVRLGYQTLMDCDTRCWFETHLGGDTLETFQATEDFDHGRPVSSIVSATTALGATEGVINFGSGSKGVSLTWNPGDCAALPMVSCQTARQKHLNRLWFSLAEMDETLKPSGDLLDFSYALHPITKNW